MATFDDVSNKGPMTVLAGGYAAGVTANISLASGEGSKLPASVPFNLVWWNSTDYANPHDDPNMEIIRVTAKSGDTLQTVTRGQESTTDVAHNTSGKTYKMACAFTKKFRDDMEAAVSSIIKSGVSATRTTTLAIPTASDTIIPFDSEIVDLNNEYVPGTGLFTAKTAGLFWVTASAYWATTTVGNSYRMRVKKNTSTVVDEHYMISPAGGSALMNRCSILVNLAVNDTIGIYMNQGDGVSRDISGGADKTNLSIKP